MHACDYAVVGGGLGGLYVAHELAREGRATVVVLEASAELGGRMKTDSRGDDKGAWRVHSGHKRMRHLAAGLGVRLVPMYSPGPVDRDAGLTNPAPALARAAKEQRLAGLSTLERLAWLDGEATARAVERGTGYGGTLDGVRKTYAAVPAAGAHYLAPESGGMGAYIHALERRLQQLPGVEVRTGCRVRGVLRGGDGFRYMVRCSQRTGPSAFAPLRVGARLGVVLNCQPCHCPPTPVPRSMRLVRASVGYAPLTRVFASTNLDLPPARKVVRSALSQVVAMAPRRLMVSYSGGLLAGMHANMALADPAKHRARLETLTRDALGMPGLELSDVRVYHFDRAVGFWKPNPAGRTLMAECATPHPVQAPGLHLVSESISESHQGWGEGALEVADLVLDRLRGARQRHPPPGSPKTLKDAGCFVYDGRVLRVHPRWSLVHPGSAKAIEAHLGEDVTELLDTVHAAKSRTFGYLLAFQVGYIN